VKRSIIIRSLTRHKKKQVTTNRQGKKRPDWGDKKGEEKGGETVRFRTSAPREGGHSLRGFTFERTTGRIVI